MKDINKVSPGYYHPEECNLVDFQKIIDQNLAIDAVPNAKEIQNNIPIYDIEELKVFFKDEVLKNELMAEWAWVLRESSGVIVLRNAYRDTSAIDEATQLYQGIIADEKIKNGGGADHFAAAGANDRIWNSLQKLCESSPDVFLRYFANEFYSGCMRSLVGTKLSNDSPSEFGPSWWRCPAGT